MEIIIISVSLGVSYIFKARERIPKATQVYMGIIIAPLIPKVLIRTRAADRVNNPYIAVSIDNHMVFPLDFQCGDSFYSNRSGNN
jgi:hypothetical protein